ncbi:MAG: ABC transporter ATP-binding protein [Deltaproteobacteria bacterium RBG_13_47_9]|nr:MAG: ABC transporter ATP-binding protein [Deltaproteobacteria bacterium RBG_13_47_9]
MLEVKDLSKTFGGLVAIRDLNFVVNKGQIVGLIGPNGSGKTTLFNLISGVLKPDKGFIKFNGMPITGLKPHGVCQKGIARTFQLTKPFANMTILQNVMVAKMYGSESIRNMKQAREECEKILEFIGLAGKSSATAATFGLVDRKRLEIARALATKPRLLLLDEVMSGLTAAEMEEAISLVKSIGDFGITLIIVEHVMKAILEISDKLIVLNYGEKIAEGTPQEVVHNKKVIEAYLGE